MVDDRKPVEKKPWHARSIVPGLMPHDVRDPKVAEQNLRWGSRALYLALATYAFISGRLASLAAGAPGSKGPPIEYALIGIMAIALAISFVYGHHERLLEISPALRESKGLRRFSQIWLRVFLVSLLASALLVPWFTTFPKLSMIMGALDLVVGLAGEVIFRKIRNP